ncbi:substrate-binding periplasmic protein [Marinobacter sp. JSM 1782161]|uniref:substrate-binding periplasmic protein n=1 Tax=Marinobacter sp. JSM 1782161 TaxID=2685906 RepID=UPI0014023B88|nr:transporter substrate-binding domain-containing protein [Marinobacter sp. JSM 1782161]
MVWARIAIAVVVCGMALVARAESPIAQAPERTYDKVIESGYLRVGVYENFPPYSYRQDGEPAGVDVDLGRRIAEALGIEFQVHWIIPDETLEDDLRNNVWKGHYLAKRRIADVMLRVPYDTDYAYMTESTGEMVNEGVVMFGPYQKETWQIAYDPDDLEGGVPTVAVFQYNPIGVEIDSLPDFYLTSAFGGRMRDQTQHYRNVGAAFDAMVAEEVTAIMGMRAEVDFLLATDPDHRFALAENGFPGIARQQWDIGMAVRHTHRQLKYAIEAIVDRMVRNGEIAAIYERYGLRYSQPAYYDAILGDSGG